MTSNIPDDELFEGLDDAEAPSADDARKEANRIAFEKRVKQNIAILLSPKKFDARQRAEAARWLGESGEPEAIEPLVKVYQRGKEDETVRAAARKALGLFKALGEAISDPEMSDDAYSLIEGIIFEGKMGKQSRWQGPFLRRVQIGLVISALLMFILGSLFSPGEAVADAPTPEAAETTQEPLSADSPQAVVEAFTQAFLQLDESNRLLAAQMSLAAQNILPDCTLTLSEPAPFNTDAAAVASEAQYAMFPDALSDFSIAQPLTQEAYQAYQAACSSASAIDPAAAARLGGNLLNAQAALDRLRVRMSAFGVTLPAAPTPIVLPTATPSPTPTPEPTATIDAVELRQQVLAIQQVLDTMTGQRGLNTLLLGYWNDALNTGSDAGCRQYPGVPLFPAAVQIPANLQSILPDEMNASAEAANIGLGLSQQSWAAFISACNSRTLRESAPSQLGLVQQAADAFDNAAALLDAAQQRLR